MSNDRREPWVNFSLQLRRDQRDAVQRLAVERDGSAADIVREAVREYLARDAATRQQEPVAA